MLKLAIYNKDKNENQKMNVTVNVNSVWKRPKVSHTAQYKI